MDIKQKLKELGNTADTTGEYEAEDIRDHRIMAVLSYISWLVLIPLFCAKESRFARYHVNQGLALAVAELAAGILCSAIYRITEVYVIYRLLRSAVLLAGLLLSLFGAVNAYKGKAKELPFIGGIRLLK